VRPIAVNVEGRKFGTSTYFEATRLGRLRSNAAGKKISVSRGIAGAYLGKAAR
jgi:hypothetical protein